MNILIVSATKFEAAPVIEKLQELHTDHNFVFKCAGVGIMQTAFNMCDILKEQTFDAALNIGLAGSFDRSIQLGEVVEVVFDRLSEEGAEDGEQFISLYELGLKSDKELRLLQATLKLKQSPLKKVNGITVNTVHGNEESIKKVSERLQPQVESMEGAAFMYACNRNNIPCSQVRAISNYVEKRNREAWEIELALNNLADSIQSLIKLI